MITSYKDNIRKIVKMSCPELMPITGDVWDETFANVKKDGGVFLYGAGERAEINESIWRKYFNDCILGFLDGDANKQGNVFCGTRVYSPDELDYYPEASIVVYTSKYEDEVVEALKARGVDESRIYTVPYPGVVSSNQYFDDEIIKFADGEEVFLDVGCFDLNTTIELKKRCKTKHVYAFEPDKYNFKKCEDRIKELGYDDVTLLSFGTADYDGEVSFASTGASYSRVADSGVFEGTDTIEVKKIDSFIPREEEVTFIKMDIEGMELAALQGASETIKRCRPKLAISIYHKTEDLTELPLYIKEIVPDYKLYIRHYSNELVETVLYAV